jgi:RNA polymerase-associated protein LEO1
MSDIDNDPLLDDAGDDLFGDDSNVGSPLEERERMLSDVELNEDDDDKIPENDESAYDARARDYSDDDDVPRTQPVATTKQRVIMDKTLYRHRLPKCPDNKMSLMRVPAFLKFTPEEYDADTYEVTEDDIQNARAGYTHESIRWQRPKDGDVRPRSNAALCRWSDGSVTLTVGGEHYSIQSKTLIPAAGQPYNETNDAHMYAAAGEVASNLMMVFAHLSEHMTVLPTGSEKDVALSKLAAEMAKAAESRQKDMVVQVTGSDNPELVRKQAEAADRELLRAQRRRENAEMRMAMGGGRPGRSSGAAGLSVGGLETGRGSLGRKRGAPGGGGAARQKRRKPEYDSDDDLPQGARRQDEYERDDGFIVSSGDEEDEIVEDDDEEEEEMDDDDDDERGYKHQTPTRAKRQRTVTPESDKAERVRDAGRSRRRVIVDDDEDE